MCVDLKRSSFLIFVYRLVVDQSRSNIILLKNNRFFDLIEVKVALEHSIIPSHLPKQTREKK